MVESIDQEIIAKAKSLGVLPEKLRNSAWIKPDKLGGGRNSSRYTDLFVLTYSSDFIQIHLPHPAKNLLEVCTILEYTFHLKVLAIEESARPVIYIDRESTVKNFNLDPTDHFAFDRIAAWMQDRTSSSQR